MSATEKLISFVCDTNDSHLPREAIQRAKSCMLDGLGVILAGYQHPASRLILDYARNVGGNAEATAIGSGFKTSPPLAALINGTMGHVLDFDDTNSEARGHLTTVLLPTILAIGEKIKAPGKNILAAYVLGFEAACKIGRAVNPEHYMRGYHATSTIGIFGATTAAGKLWGLSPVELGYAYGIAGSRSSGLRSNFGTMTKSLHAGLAAHDAIMAVFLGKGGYTSNARILETEGGFGQVMGRDANFEKAFQNLGDPLAIISSGVVVKLYPSGALIHPAVDAVLGLMRENHIRPAEIVSIRCGTNEDLFKILIHPRPKNGLEAKFSIPYCLARACLDGKLGIEDFLDEKVLEPRVQDLMKRVVHYAEPEIDPPDQAFRAAAKVTINLQNGQVLVKKVEKAKGSPDHPLSFEELAQKFRVCAKGNISEDQIDKTIQVVAEMENVSDINQIMGLLIRSRIPVEKERL
jgi:2-methylcitrate dehydratase PrpD